MSFRNLGSQSDEKRGDGRECNVHCVQQVQGAAIQGRHDGASVLSNRCAIAREDPRAPYRRVKIETDTSLVVTSGVDRARGN